MITIDLITGFLGAGKTTFIEKYARLNNISVTEAVVTGLNVFLNKFKEKLSTKETYYISPTVKALEGGFKCPKNLSDDYKEEIRDSLTGRYML